MTAVPPVPGRTHARHDPRAVITDARAGASDDLARRQRRYFVAMAFRVACFVGIVFISGWVRWVLLAAAVILPYVAVVFANQADHRTPAADPVARGEPSPAPELGIGDSDVIPGETDDGPETRSADEHGR